MFGHAYFGASYYGPTYWGPAVDTGPELLGGGGETRKRRYKRKGRVTKEEIRGLKLIFDLPEKILTPPPKEISILKEEKIEFEVVPIVDFIEEIVEPLVSQEIQEDFDIGLILALIEANDC